MSARERRTTELRTGQPAPARTSVARAIACIAVLAAACDRPPRAEPVISAASEVRHFGALHEIVHEGRTGANVELRSVVPGPHAFAVGALSELRGEVTILDDVVWLAYPEENDTSRVVHGSDATERATLLVVQDVPAWRRATLESAIPFDALDREIERLASAHGAHVDAPFAFRIEGTLEDLAWHVVDGRRIAPGMGHDAHMAASVRRETTSARATIVGFYSAAHAGVFTHMGVRTHMHVVLEDGTGTGHVDHVRIPAGAVLFLPR